MGQEPPEHLLQPCGPQALPFVDGQLTDEPLQACSQAMPTVPPQCVPAPSGLQVPVPQLPQPPLQRELQQTPPTHMPEVHWLPTPQPPPLPTVGRHTPLDPGF